VGGGAELCDLADSQDESAVQYYSEVLAFAFFTAAGASQAAANSMLPVPFTLLGARRYVKEISGESTSGRCGRVEERNWLNERIPTDVVRVNVNGSAALVVSGAFVAVASACSACIAGSACDMATNVNNQCNAQRRHLDDDVDLWFQAYDPTMYAGAVQDAFSRIVKYIGTGPWGAGVWYGDSQQYFLTVWMATALLSGASLHYYIYDHFCENPGNQCFVLGKQGCSSCIAKGSAGTQVQAKYCGTQSVYDMVSRFKGQPAQSLYGPLKQVRGPPLQVFDVLAGSY